MSRIRYSLLLAFAGAALAVADVGAREVSKLSPNDACSESSPRKDAAAARPGQRGAPQTARDTKAKPSVHSDAEPGNRLQSPRWHNFLPGMFR